MVMHCWGQRSCKGQMGHLEVNHFRNALWLPNLVGRNPAQIIIIIVDICYAPVSARRRSWRRPLLLPCHYQEIIRTISLLIRLFAANGQLLAQTYEHLDYDIPLNKYPTRLGRRSKRGKVICPGSQHVGRSGARTHNLTFMSPALFRCTI